MDIKEYAHAMKQFKACYHAREALFTAEHPLSADALHHVGMVYAKRGELTASLPFLLRALELRIGLNETFCQQREDDSDEDPRDLELRESERDRRIRLKREAREKELERQQ